MVSIDMFCRTILSKMSATFWDHALLSRPARGRLSPRDRRRVPFTRQRIALWRIEPHGQIKWSLWRWKPIGFHVRAWTFILEIKG
jgi:hypothetical protein